MKREKNTLTEKHDGQRRRHRTRARKKLQSQKRKENIYMPNRKKKNFFTWLCCLPEINSNTLRNSYIFCATFSVVIFNGSIWFLFTFFFSNTFAIYCLSLSLSLFLGYIHAIQRYTFWDGMDVGVRCLFMRKMKKRNIWKFCLILANALRDFISSIKIQFAFDFYWNIIFLYAMAK